MSIFFQKFLILFIILFLLITSFFSINLNWIELFNLNNWINLFSFFSEFMQPNLSYEFISDVFFLTIETLSMSIISTFFAFIFGISIMIFLEFKSTISIFTINSLLNLLRSIPELIWALILLVAFGLGPFTGTMALFLHTSGILGKLFIDIYKNIPRDNKVSLLVCGNNQIRILLYQTLPLIFPQLLSYTLYRWENNIRAASILGIVGAGGLGQLLYYNLSLFQYEKVATIIIVIFIMVLFVDHLSFYFRKKLT